MAPGCGRYGADHLVRIVHRSMIVIARAGRLLVLAHHRRVGGAEHPVIMNWVKMLIGQHALKDLLLKSDRSAEHCSAHWRTMNFQEPEIDALHIRLIDGRHECRTFPLNEEIAL